MQLKQEMRRMQRTIDDLQLKKDQRILIVMNIATPKRQTFDQLPTLKELSRIVMLSNIYTKREHDYFSSSVDH